MEHNFRFKCCSFAAVTMKLLFPLVMLVCANFLPIDAADLCSPVNPCQNAGRCTSTGDTSYQCQCSTGYWGTNCTFFNPCSQAGACYNGATCSNVSSVTYVCRCPAGYVGAQCQTLDPCSPNPCGQSQCVFNEAASPQYRCVCTVGTTGPNCAQLDPCAQLPCQNGATCVSVSDGASYQCQCASGYQGTNCDWYNPCLTESSPCFNGATCSTPISGRFSCACPLGYYGSQCGEQNACLLNAASQNILCKHGDCISTGNTSYQCSCHAGWYGADCSQYNPCAVSPTPCLNQGTCSSPGSLLYQCLCPAGYYGVNCQFYNPCTAFPDGTLCFNGATCRNTTSGNYTCSCRQGYYGDSCSFYNPCWSSPCINGATCTNAVLNSFQCLCEAGFYGTLCGQLNGCFSSPCTNGATCTNTSDSGAFTCACAAGYRGPLCQTYDPCSGPGTQCIQNGGTCIQVTGGNGYACFCNTGFYGANCEYFNPCSSSPCSNGGTCSNMTNVIYSCQCQSAYSGLRCEIHSPCLLAPCQNGATCNDILTDPSITNGQFRCTCNAGYYGSHCELVNGCLLSGDTVCLNGGICTNTTISGSITCSCEAGYYGSRCNDGFNPCVVGSGPCLNGAVCSNTTSGSFYVCTCIQGYYGDRCQNWNPCWRGPCLNGGQCRNLTNSTYSCDCIPPLLGSNCQNYDFCDVGVCQNGALSCTLSGVNLGFLDSTKLRNVSVQYGSGSVADVKIVNSFGCACAPGFTGLTCDADINECLSGPCFNAATCINTYGSYWCSCQSGFTGNNCQLDVNQCRSSPCFNGATCLNAVNAFSCKCAPGFTGAFCQTQINECLSSPCLNQGTCIDQVASFYCQCQPGYTGTICQSIINACQSNPCRNAGTCYNQTTACTDTSNCPLSPIAAGSFWCGCAVGFTGSQCQTEINECLSNPCQNGATCVDLVGSFRCDCPAGFTGNQCETNINECQSSPCVNGGTCTDSVNRFQCSCPIGYYGDNCAIIGSCSDSTTVSDYGTFQWPFTLAQSNSSVAYLPCPYGPSSTSISSSSSVASRVCSSQLASAVWLDPDYSRCRLSDLAIANYTLYDYDKTTSYPSTLTADQVSQIADGLLAVVKYVTPSQQPLLAIMLMNIVDHLTQVNQSVMQDSQAVNQTADKLLNLVSKFTRDVVFPLSASSYGLLYRTLNYSIVHVDAVIIDVNVTAYRAIGEDNSTAPAQISVNSSVRTSSVTVSLSPVLNYTAEQRLVTVFYANDLFYRPLKLAKPYVTSDVISVTLSNVTSSDASDEQLVTLSIRLQPELMKYTLIECAYWNPLDHEWSTSGVTTILGENRLVTCQSQHLSSFTVVTANETEVEAFTVPETVTYISYIGCGVCMGCVLTTLIIYCLLQFAESNKFGKIWINVCLAILLLNVFFVVASRWLLCNTAGCTALTYLFHVFLLASFLWLLIDIVGFYQKVVTDFITYEKHFLIGRILAGWGFPLVAAAVTLIIDVVQYEPASIYCRTPLQRPSVFYVTFLGYVCLAVLVGILVFVGTLVAIARRKDNDPRVIIHQIASTPVILCLSGAAWIIGLLAARFGGLGLEVAFCIVNSISGLAILIDRGIVEQREILLHPCLSSGDNDSMDSTEAAIAQGRRRHHSTDSIDSFGSQSPGGVVGRTILSSGRRDTHDVFATSAIITPASGNHNGGRWGRWPASRKKDNEQMKYGRPDVHITGTLRRNETSDEHEAVKSKPTVSGANDVNQPAAAPNNGTYRIITTTDVNNETLTYI